MITLLRDTFYRLIYEGKYVDFKPSAKAFNMSLQTLNVPIHLIPERPAYISLETYLAAEQQTCFHFVVAGVVFEFNISDHEMSVSQDAVKRVLQEIHNGCYWKE
jgi:hypothetical protein